MVSRRTDRLLHKITHHTNKTYPYDKNISGFDYPIQDYEILGREITLRYKNRYIPDKKVSEDEDYAGPDTFEEDDDNDNIDNIYENDFIILRCDQAPPYRFIGISVDYTVILVGDSRTYDDEDIVFKYPKQFEEYLGLYLINEYTDSEQFGEVPPDQIQRLRGVVLSCDSMEPGESVIAEFYDHNKTRFILESEVQSVVMDRYDSDSERDYNGLDPEDHGLVYINIDGKFATSEGESIYLDANGGYPDPLADMYRKDILSQEEVCELRGRIIEEREIFGLDLIYPREITLNTTTLNLNKNETYQLVATIPPTATYNTITWVSSDESIATVDGNGLVISVGSGKAKIYATCLDVWARCTVTATINVQGVELNESSIEMVEGEYEVLVATVLPENASNKKVVWSSSNEAVAKVTQKGKVTILSPGTATITVTTKDGGFTASCEVTGISSYIPVESIRVYNDNIDMNDIILSPNGYAYGGNSYPKSVTFNVEILPANATNKAINIRGKEILPESGASTTNRSDYCCYARKISDNLVEIEACCDWCFNSDIYRVYSLDNNSIYQDIKISKVYTAIEDFEFAPISQSDLFMDLDDPLFNSGKSININLYPRLWTANHVQLIGVEMGMAYSLASSVRNYGDISNMISTLDYDHMISEPSKTTAAIKYFIPYPKPNPSPGIQTLEVTNPNNGVKKTINVTIGQQSISRLRITNIPQDWSQYSPGDQFTVNVECTPNYWTDYPNFYGVINWSVSGNNNNIEITVSGNAQETATIRILSACEGLVITATSSKFPNITDSFTMTIEEPYVPVEYITLYRDDPEYSVYDLQLCTNPNNINQSNDEKRSEILNVQITPENATNKSIGVRYVSYGDTREDYCSTITKLSDSRIEIAGVCYDRQSYDTLQVYSLDNEDAYVDVLVNVSAHIDRVEFDVDDPQESFQIGLHENKQLKVNFYPQNWSVNHIEQTGVNRYEAVDAISSFSTVEGSTNISSDAYEYEYNTPEDDPCTSAIITINSDDAIPGTDTMGLNFDPSKNITIGLEVIAQPLEALVIEDVPEDYSEFDPVNNNTFTVRVKSDPEWMLESILLADIYGYLKWSISGPDVANVVEEYDEDSPDNCEWVVTAYDDNGLDIIRITYNTYYPDYYGDAEITILGPCNNVVLTVSTSEFPNVTQSFIVNTVGDMVISMRIYSEEKIDQWGDYVNYFETGWSYPDETDSSGLDLWKWENPEYEEYSINKVTLHVQTYPIVPNMPTINLEYIGQRSYSGPYERTDFACKATKKSSNTFEFEGYCDCLGISEIFEISCLGYSREYESESIIAWDIDVSSQVKIENWNIETTPQDLKLPILYNENTGKYYIEDKTYYVSFYPQYWSVNHIEQTGARHINSGFLIPDKIINGGGTALGLTIPSTATPDKLNCYEQFTISSNNITKPGTRKILVNATPYETLLAKSITVEIGEQQINSITIAGLPQNINVGDTFDLSLIVDPFYWNNWSTVYGAINWTVTGNEGNIVSTSVSNNVMQVTALTSGTVTITATSVKFPNVSDSVTVIVQQSIIPVEHIRIYYSPQDVDTDYNDSYKHGYIVHANPESEGHTIEFNLEITPANATDKSLNIVGSNTHLGDICSTLVQISDNKLLATGVTACAFDDYSLSDEFTISSVSNPEVSTYLYAETYMDPDDFDFDITPEDLNIELKYNERTGKHYIDNKIFRVNVSPLYWSVNHVVQRGPDVAGMEDIDTTITGLTFGYYDKEENNRYYEYILRSPDSNVSGPGTATLSITMYNYDSEEITKSITVNIIDSSVIPVEGIYIDENGDLIESSNAWLSPDGFDDFPTYKDFTIKVLPENATDKSIYVDYEEPTPGWDDYSTTITKLSDTSVRVTGIAANGNDSGNSFDTLTVHSTDNPNLKVSIYAQSYVMLDDFDFDQDTINIDLKYDESNNKYYIDDTDINLSFSPKIWSVNHIVEIGPTAMGFGRTISGDVTGLSTTIVTTNQYSTEGSFTLKGSNISGAGTAIITLKHYGSGVSKAVTVNIQEPGKLIDSFDYLGPTGLNFNTSDQGKIKLNPFGEVALSEAQDLIDNYFSYKITDLNGNESSTVSASVTDISTDGSYVYVDMTCSGSEYGMIVLTLRNPHPRVGAQSQINCNVYVGFVV